VRSLAALAVATAFAPVVRAEASSAAGVVENLVVAESRVHLGTVVSVTTTSCPSPETVVSVSHRTTHPMAKGMPPYVPLSLDTISLAQTGSGVSFQYVPTEARSWEDFELVCSDGTTSITADPVAVHPPAGQAWWGYNTYEQNVFHADPGYVFFLGIRTIECATGETATASIDGYDSHDWTFTAPVPDDGIVVWDVPIPADIHQGHYIIDFSCPKEGGGFFTAQTFVVIGLPELDVLGGSTTLAWWAFVVTASGFGLVTIGRGRDGRRLAWLGWSPIERHPIPPSD